MDREIIKKYIEEYAHTVPLHKTVNAREYVNKAGAGFALVDNTRTMALMQPLTQMQIK